MPEVDNTLPPIQPPTEPTEPEQPTEQPTELPAEYPAKPEDSQSPNTPARPVTIEEDYRPPDPPDAYQNAAPVQFTEAGTTADGQPAHPELPTTNAYEGGGLPLNPREPYATGNGPEDAGKIKGRP